MKNKLIFILTIAGIALSALANAQKPNIIFIMTDDMGNGDISLNHNTVSTPIIDSLANNGAYFPRYYAQSICTPTRAALMTGRYPFRYSLHASVIWPYENRKLPATKQLLPEKMKEAGYTTAIIGKWHLGHGQPNYLPHVRGFDYSYGHATGGTDYITKTTYIGGYDYQSNGLQVPNSGYLTTDLAAKAVSWIEKVAADPTTPFFLYWAEYTPHEALVYTRQRSLDSLEAGVSRIWSKVRELGIENNTIIIFTSDNGADGNSGGSNHPYQGIKGQITEGGIRVPFAWYHSGTVSPQVVDSIVGVIDIFPTLLSIAGATMTPADSIDGVNFARLLGYDAGEEYPINRSLIGQLTPGRQWCVMQGPYKLTNNVTATIREVTPLSDNIQLFNVVSDPGESTDISSGNASIVSQLQAIVDDFNDGSIVNPTWISSAPPGWVTPSVWAVPQWFYNPSYLYFGEDR